MKVTKTPITKTDAKRPASKASKAQATENAKGAHAIDEHDDIGDVGHARDAGATAGVEVMAHAIQFEGVAHGTEFQWGSVKLAVLDAGGNIPTFTAKGRQWLLRNDNVSWRERLSAGNEQSVNGDPNDVYVKKVDTGGIDEIVRNMKGTVVDGRMLVDHGPMWGVHSPARLETKNGKSVIVNEWIGDGMKLRREIHPEKDGALFSYELTALLPKDGGSSKAKSAYYAPHIKVPIGPKTRIVVAGNPKFLIDPGSVKNIANVDTGKTHAWPHVGDVDLSAPASTAKQYHVKTHIIMPDDSDVAKMTLVEGSRALDFTWDRKAMPQAGNWFNRGGQNFGVMKDGKPAPMCVDAGLEPTNGLCDDPNSPRNKDVPKLKPGETTTFWYRLSARDVNDLGSG